MGGFWGPGRMSELTLLVLQLGFLLLLWVFIFAIVYALRSDLFGQRVRKLQPDAAAARPCAGGRVPRRGRERRHPRRRTAAVSHPAAPASGPGGETASTENATRLVITSGAEGRRRVPARSRRDHHRPLQRLGDHHPRRLHLHPPRAPHAVERPLDDPGPRLHQRHLPRRLPRDRARRRSRSEPPSRSARRRSSCGGSAMATVKASAAVSHVGRVRSNNQDSGYAGRTPVPRRRRHGRARRR